jgi:hypothetical protein
MERAEELVGESMPAHVSNILRTDIVHWYDINLRAITQLLRVHCGTVSPRLPLTL